MASGTYSGIPVTLLRHCRTVLSRKTEPDGKAMWIAEVPDTPWCRATGSSRIEALDRVRAMGERRKDDERLRRRLSARQPQPDQPAADGAGGPRGP
jgi:hypothetical protein